ALPFSQLASERRLWEKARGGAFVRFRGSGCRNAVQCLPRESRRGPPRDPFRAGVTFPQPGRGCYGRRSGQACKLLVYRKSVRVHTSAWNTAVLIHLTDRTALHRKHHFLDALVATGASERRYATMALASS